ncbi:MAG TPA: LysR family transcriptional regulator [Acetobacteraceae bacterium]|jgi:DNA-binding transcriptional LysR family regulator|nr:LysR family transcriptional regulator [Acetobacteraceae bacterium]
MLDGVSLDQLRTFIAAADGGSFSAAGRRLHRAQSVVSQTLANLEARLGVSLFDRSGRYPVLTQAGRALLADARAVATGMDLFKARAKGLAEGLEPELSVVVDVMFPIEIVTSAVVAFQAEFPATPLRLYVEALGAVVAPVLSGTCAFGVMGSLPLAPPELSRERLLAVRLGLVVSPSHPLLSHAGPIPSSVLAQHIQLVLTDRTRLSEGQEFGVLSPKTWRLADLGAKHAFLRAGLGFGGMPLAAVREDLAQGTLVEITAEDMPADGTLMPMFAIYRTDTPPGPAGRWLIERLRQIPAACPPSPDPARPIIAVP